jgi:hypothetical protein
MSGLQGIVDRFEIEALRGEFTDAVMMRDYGWRARRPPPRRLPASQGRRGTLQGRRSIDVELVALGILHGDSVVVEPLFL